MKRRESSSFTSIANSWKIIFTKFLVRSSNKFAVVFMNEDFVVPKANHFLLVYFSDRKDDFRIFFGVLFALEKLNSELFGLYSKLIIK